MVSMDGGSILKDIVINLMVLGKDDRYIAKRVGMDIEEVRSIRRSAEHYGVLRERVMRYVEGVDGSIGLFNRLVRSIVENIDTIKSKDKVLEVLVKHCGFGKLLEGSIASEGSSVGVSKEERLMDMGLGRGGVVDLDNE